MNLISELDPAVNEDTAGNQSTLYWCSDEPHPLSLNERNALLIKYQSVRQQTERIVEPLSAEDLQIQSMPDASPGKWHLAHTSWFFETFILQPHCPDYDSFDPDFHHLFNSYYNALGTPFARPQRGLLSRPSLDQVFSYRQHIDREIERWLTEQEVDSDLANLLVLGLNHEQQHQELLLTDIKHGLSINPMAPAYSQGHSELREEMPLAEREGLAELSWLRVPEDTYTLGSDGKAFSFDNEGPAHQRYQPAFRIASRLVTNAEYLAFMNAGGYQQSRLWLSDGWAHVNQNGMKAPLYWREVEGTWYQFTLSGLQPINLDAPVCHVNFYEADAFATWAGFRLPTEFEWEIAAWLHCQKGATAAGNMLDSGYFHPQPEHDDLNASDNSTAQGTQLLGNVWQWTSSAYQPYPGFKASADAVGEYNGKFMCNQMVLRGGSCVTPRSHIRISYRNFFYPHQSWQFTGIRLAGDDL
ncbi:ergothioneine biosynthesis protein EgtB [Microbulbifer agarilyticus]|uniref:ergothioneine biosynthesis protein EgtB n=1 Tax=Microbulbifer agarilyticus TaxID=260552 RepID=UPI001CD5E4C4|nr:ergothioneine biosynthesis protein EgtB [Microbulbifer agarilyticus]MCA0891845.1 ergothioneine biosynthesis protein EgtB [Microbulbifer agarilyticus]